MTLESKLRALVVELRKCADEYQGGLTANAAQRIAANRIEALLAERQPMSIPTLTFDGTSYDCAKCGNRQIALCEHWQALFERAHAAICLGRPALTERQEPRDFERPEGLYLKLCEPLAEPNTPVIIERVNGDCSVSHFIIARDEAYNLIKQMQEFLEGHSHRNHAAQPSSGTGERSET